MISSAPQIITGRPHIQKDLCGSARPANGSELLIKAQDLICPRTLCSMQWHCQHSSKEQLWSTEVILADLQHLTSKDHYETKSY